MIADEPLAFRAAMESARRLAQYSPDPSRKNGAVLLDREFRLVSTGINTFPINVESRPERWERPTKYLYVEHAERNAIYEAARHGVCSNYGTLVCLWAACADCARAIIQAGLVRLVRERYASSTDDRWNASILAGDEMLREAGVEIIDLEPIVFEPARRDAPTFPAHSMHGYS